jgi:hypothetical protein
MNAKDSTSTDFLMAYDRSLRVLPLSLALFSGLALLLASLFLPSGLGPTPEDWFTDYARALFEGRLYIGEGNQWRDCKWDLSFFEGKCYLYFGIVPAIFHGVFPFVTNRAFSILATTLFVFFFTKIFLRMSQLTKNDSVDWLLSSLMVLGATCACGFISLALCSRVYEETICFAHAFGMAGLYFALPFLNVGDRTPLKRELVFSSILFSLAALTRVTWFPVLMLFCGFVFLNQRKSQKGWGLWVTIFPPFICLGLALFFQGGLNWVRFHNPLELGTTYQSTQLRFSKKRESAHGLNSPVFALKNFFSYYLIRLFPQGGIVITKKTGILQEWLLKDTTHFESPHTLSWTLPFSFLPLLDFRSWFRFLKKGWQPIVLLLTLWLATLSIDSVIYRYQFEVSASFVLATVPYLISRSSRLSNKWFLGIVLMALLGLTCAAYFSFEVINRFWGQM